MGTKVAPPSTTWVKGYATDLKGLAATQTNAIKTTTTLNSALMGTKVAGIVATKATKNATKATKEAAVHQRSFFQDLSKGGLAATGKIWMAYAGNIATMTAGFIAVTAAVKGFNDAIEFDYLVKYSAAISDTSTSVEELKDSILGIKGTAQGPVALAEGFRELTKAGKEVDEIIGKDMLKSMAKFSTVAEMTVGESVQFTVAQANAFGRSLEDVADILTATAFSAPISFQDLNQSMKHTVELASVAGVTLEEVAVALALVGEKGLKGSMAGTALRTAMEKLVTPSEKVSKALKLLGADINDAFGADGRMSIKKSMELYYGVYKQLDAISRVQLTKEWFGLRSQKDVSAMIDAIMDGGKAWEEQVEKIEAAQKGVGAVAEAYKEMQDSARVAFAEFAAGVSRNAVGDLQTAVEKMIPTIKLLRDNVDDIWDGFMFVGGVSIVALLGSITEGLWKAGKAATGLRGAVALAGGTMSGVLAGAGALYGGYKLGGMIGAGDEDEGLLPYEKYAKDVEEKYTQLERMKAAIEKSLADKKDYPASWRMGLTGDVGSWREEEEAKLKDVNKQLEEYARRQEIITKNYAKQIEVETIRSETTISAEELAGVTHIALINEKILKIKKDTGEEGEINYERMMAEAEGL